MSQEQTAKGVGDWSRSIAETLLSVYSQNVLPPLSEDDFQVFKTHKGPHLTAAVDGSSSVILKAPNFIVGFQRVLAIIFDDGNEVDRREEAGAPIFIRKPDLNRDFLTHCKLIPRLTNKVKDPETVLSLVREAKELEMIESLVSDLPAGSMLLVDGTLMPGIPHLENKMADILGIAEDRNIKLIGLSKSTSLSLKGIPLLPHIQYWSNRMVHKKKWYLNVPVTFGQDIFRGNNISSRPPLVTAVKLHPLSQFVFRADLFPGNDPSKYLGVLSRYCRDAGYPGYPYPLVKVHNEVAITKAESEDMVNELERTALETGMSGSQWRYLIQDFHDILDRGT